MNALKLIGRGDDDAPDWTDRLMRQWQRYPADPSGRGDFPNAQHSGMASHDLLTGADPREVVNPDAPLTPDEEARFRAWLKQNPDSTKTDAELRQIWKAQDTGSPNALRAAARQPSQSLKDPDREHPGDFADRLGTMRPGRGLTTGDRGMAVPGLAPLTDPQMERTYTGNLNQDQSSYALQGAMPIAWGDLRPLPANTPVSQLPSYQQGTDYVPEDGPAKLHEGEMVIPKREADRIRAADMPSVTVKPRLSQEDIEKLWRDRGYPPAGAKGAARNAMRESGGSSSVMGDQGTSGGLFQHHNTRLAELKTWAAEHGKPWTDPATQVDFADHELQTKFPELRKRMMAATDDNVVEDQFKRIFERPASVMWSNDASGRPVLGNDRYRFSDYALGEHSGRRGTSLLYMDPQDYLDLSPPFDDDPKTSRSGRSLRASVGRGDAVESVPSLDMRVQGQTGTVTAQDGRNRALLAQEEGLDAIPVAVRQKGQGEPTEIAGMSGTILPNDFRKAEHVSRETSPDRSILGRAMDMIIPRAEATETKPGAAPGGDEFWKQGAIPLQTQDGGSDEFWKQGAVPVSGGGQPSGDRRSVADRIGTGMVDPFVGVAQLTGNVVGGGMSMLPGALGRAGTSLQDFTNRKTAEREAGIQGERGGETGIDWWRLGGNVASPINLIPMGALGRAGSVMGALGRGAVAGGVGALTQPVTEGDFTTGKIGQVAGGAAAGGVLGAAGQVASKALAPTLRKAVDTLMKENVQLTPGQMAGGHIRSVEDTAASIPGLGSQIKIAQRRSVETFNRAAINRSLSDIGLELPKDLHSGHDAINYAHSEFSKAYNSVIPRMTGREDPTLRQDLVDIVNRAQQQNLPKEYLDQLHDIIGHEIVERFNQGNGRMSGVDAQTVGTQINDLRKAMKISPNPYQQRLGRLLGNVDDALDRMMERQNPVLQAQRDKIDAGYAKFKIVQDAAKRASSMRETPEGTFTPAQLAQAVKGRDTTKDKAAYARGAALMQDLSNAAREVLPSVVPNSGTAERAGMVGLAAGAGHFISPWTVPALGAGMAAYSNRGVQLTNAIMSRLGQQAGPRRNALAGALQRTGPVAGPMAGIAGANALTDMQSITVRPEGAAPQ